MKMGKPTTTAAVLIINAIFFTVMAKGCTPIHLEYTLDTGVRRTITEADLTAVVPRPITGAVPQSAFIRSQYTGTVVWTPADTPFQGGSVYSAVLSLSLSDGWSLTGASFTHDEGTVHQVENIITIEFPATEILKVDGDLAAALPAPVKGAAAVREIVQESYTAAVAWKPADDPFRPDTVYTAVVRAVPKEGYTLEGVEWSHGVNPLSPLEDGGLEIVFPATEAGPSAVTDLDLSYITAPVIGAEPYAGPIERTGYTGTAFWVSADHPFKELTAYTVSLDLTARRDFLFEDTAFVYHGGALIAPPEVTKLSESHVLVKLYFAALGHSGEIKSPVDDLELSGVIPAPVRGEFPLRGPVYREQYDITGVTWTPGHTIFAADTAYGAELTLRAKGNYTFAGLGANSFRYSVYWVGVSNPAGEGETLTVRLSFPVTVTAAITEDLDLSYIGLPAAGEVPTVNGSFVRGQYTGIALWSPPDPAFAGGTAYTATAILTPKKGYHFEGAGDCVYSASSETVVTQNESGENRVVTLQFPAVDSPPAPPAVDPPPEPPAGEKTVIGAVNLNGYIIPPVIGSAPYVAGFTASDQHFSGGTVSWTEGGAAVTGYFLTGKLYQAAVTLSAGEGYTFDAAAPVTYDYAAAGGVSHSPAAGLSDTLRVSLSFPALTTGRIPVSDFDLAPYFDAPVVDKVPAAVVSGAAFQYSGTVSWTPDPSGSFAPETVYTAAVHLSPKTGYTFEEVGADAFKHGGSPGTNAAGSGDITIVFPPTGEIGHLTLLGTATGKTYTAEVFSSTREIEDYPAFASATLAGNQVAAGAGQGNAADAEGLAIFLNAFGGSYTGTGRLLTVRVTDTVTGELEDIYYQPQMPFVNGSAVFDLAAAKSRNRDLLGGAVTFRAALERIWGGERGDFNLTPEGETVDSTWPSSLLTISTGGDISINGNGKTITVTRTGTVLTISNAARLTLAKITLKASTLNTSAPLISVGSLGHLTLDLGATLVPGWIRVSEGKLVMEPGSLVSLAGIGSNINSVYLVAGGEFEMKGGEISGSSSNGVQISSGNFIMTGGTITSNNYGVQSSGPSMSMHDGKISGNRSGGVSGTLIMYGGEISGNTAGNGGGVIGTLIMHGGEISGNTATNGGGVYGTLIMHGGEISGNTATNGGGVYATGGFTLNGGEISGNTAGNGGGVYVAHSLSSVSLISGKIGENVASSSSGSGAYGYGGMFFTDTAGPSPANLESIVRENRGYGSGVINGGNHNFPLGN